MTWDEYKEETKAKDPAAKQLLEQAEIEAHVVSAIIKQRNKLGMSQRDLAEQCEIPQSSVARIESSKTMPRLDTLAKILTCLDLKLTVTPQAVPVVPVVPISVEAL